MNNKLLVMMVSTFLLPACVSTGTTKIYESVSQTNNLIVRLKTDSFDDIETAGYIRKTYDNCATEYLGEIVLDKPETTIALPVNQRSFITIVLKKSGILGDSTISYGSYITSNSGYRHEFYLEYQDGLYDSSMYKVNNQTNKKKEVKTVPFEGCQTL